MATQVQNRRGTTTQHSTFTGANGELTVDTDKKTVVVHDGTTAGGAPLLRENGSQNAVTTGTSTAASFIPTSSTVPTNGVYLPAANSVAISTNGVGRLSVSSTGDLTLGTSTAGGTFYVLSNSGGYNGPAIVGQPGGTSAWHVGTSANFAGDGSTDLALQAGTSRNIRFYTGGATERMRLDSQGRLGVGTTTPATDFVAFKSGVGLELDTSGGFAGAANTGTLRAFDRPTLTYRTLGLTGSNVILGVNDQEAARIDSSKRLLVGTSSARSNIDGSTPQVQLEGTSYATSTASFIRNSADAGRPFLTLGKSRGASIGSNTIVQSGDHLGTIQFTGADGTNLVSSALIDCNVEGTPALGKIGSRLVFSTTADGASSPTERFRIASGGDLVVFNSGAIKPNTDNATLLGISGGRWSAVWAANGTIQTSDQRAKLDITSSTLGADFIKSLRPVSYKWIEGGKRDTGERDADGNYIYESVPGERTHWGFIAQEVKQAVDAAGVDFGGWVLTDKDDPDSQQALRYDQFIAPLTKALQEALAEIDVLKAKVAALEAA